MKKNINKITFTSFILLFVLIIFGDLFEYIPVYSKKISNISYDSLSSNKELKTPKVFSFDDFNGLNLKKEIEISFDFRIYDLKRDYSNVFQTADYNNGIRMEFSRTNAALLAKGGNDTLWGKSLAFNDGKNIKKGLNLPLKNLDYKIKIIKKINKPLTIFVNNIERKTNYHEDFWQFNNVIIGQGYDETRPFDGKISNFSLNYSVFKTYPIVCILVNTLKILLALVVVLGFIYISINKYLKKEQESFNVKYFLPGVLFTLYYPTFLYLRNMFEMSFSEFVLVAFVLLAIWTVLYFLFSRIYSQRDTFFILCCAIGYFFACRFITNFIGTLHFGYAEQLCICIFVALGFVCYGQSEKFFKTVSFAIYILCTLLIITSITDIYTFIVKNISINQNMQKSQINKKVLATSKELPDFYFIILDAYPNGEKLKKYFNFSNEEFLRGLEAKGFYVARKSYANYFCTFQSLPSMLNFSYLDDLNMETPNQLEYLNNMENKYNNNALTKLLHKNNYKIFMINSHNMISSKMTLADVIYNSEEMKSLSLKNILLSTSALSKFVKVDYTAREKILKAFKDLDDAAAQNGDEPKFVFAHILSPHFPFVFDEKGNLPKEDNKNMENGFLDKELLTGQILYINKQIEPIVDKILAKDRKVIILILSDHSLELYPLSFESAFDFRMGNLEAIYTYDKNYDDFYDSMTPVTVIRKILNKYYNTELPVKEDYIYSTHPRTFYYNPTDITDKMKQMND
ncbi:MAG: sulfatase-like hydrolase/transferase [Candidatus Gastranaerophilales bacterium]|nr:sulfatase-like hydrolase/transferase [Candidatus Gastranaerophilales bacterium]